MNFVFFFSERRQFEYSCGRSSALWEVSKPAMKCGDRERTLYLARHKDVHSQYQRPREVQSIVSQASMNAKASPHVENLAQAKVRDSGQYRDPEWQVSASLFLSVQGAFLWRVCTCCKNPN